MGLTITKLSSGKVEVTGGAVDRTLPYAMNVYRDRSTSDGVGVVSNKGVTDLFRASNVDKLVTRYGVETLNPTGDELYENLKEDFFSVDNVALTPGYALFLSSNNTEPINTANQVVFTAASSNYALLTSTVVLDTAYYISWCAEGGNSRILGYSANGTTIIEQSATQVFYRGGNSVYLTFIHSSLGKLTTLKYVGDSIELWEGDTFIESKVVGLGEVFTCDQINKQASTNYTTYNLRFLDIDGQHVYSLLGGYLPVMHDEEGTNHAYFANDAGTDPTWGLGVDTPLNCNTQTALRSFTIYNWFDGVSDYVSIPLTTITNYVEISFVLDDDGVANYLLGRNSDFKYIRTETTPGRVRIASDVTVDFDFAETINKGETHTLRVVPDGGSNVRMYLNGVESLDGSQTVDMISIDRLFARYDASGRAKGVLIYADLDGVKRAAYNEYGTGATLNGTAKNYIAVKKKLS